MQQSRLIVPSSLLSGHQAYWTWVKMALEETAQETAGTPRDWYLLMEAYYLNNGLYDVLRAFWGDQAGIPANVKSLRNPAYRVTQFHTAHLWPGSLPDALPIVTDNDKIVEPIHDVWTWSNWATKKQLAARWAALFGDLFIKVGHKESLKIISSSEEQVDVTFDRPDKVILQLIEPQHVTEFDYDGYGVVTWIRMDVPSSLRERNGTVTDYTHVEVWDLEGVRVWRDTENRENVSLEQLGDPVLDIPLERLKLDYIPIVWQPFLEMGKGRGLNSFGGALEKIDEANQMASRLHQMIFRYNRPLWALKSNHVDQVGAPLPPPRLGSVGADELEIGDDTVLPLPGNTALESMVPQLDYGSVLQSLSDHMTEIEMDLPEMTYYNMRQYSGELSGKAIQLRLSAAVDKVLEARGNLEAGLARANMMALSIGKAWNLWPEVDYGTYAEGDLHHQFAPRQVIPLSEYERSQIFQTYRTGELPMASALRFAGKTEDQIDDVESEAIAAEKKQAASLSTAVLNAQRAMNQPPDEGDEDAGISSGPSEEVPAASSPEG